MRFYSSGPACWGFLLLCLLLAFSRVRAAESTDSALLVERMEELLEELQERGVLGKDEDLEARGPPGVQEERGEDLLEERGPPGTGDLEEREFDEDEDLGERELDEDEDLDERELDEEELEERELDKLNLLDEELERSARGAAAGGVDLQTRGCDMLSPKPPSCTPEYEVLCDSTMCNYASDPARDVSKDGVSKAEAGTITMLHNKYRRTVSPTATNMMKISWDANLAKVAQHFATSCPNIKKINKKGLAGHDTDAGRRVPAYPEIYVGQGLAWGFANWAGAMKGWWAEHKDWQYGVGRKPGHESAMLGHYIQLAYWEVTGVGCGYAMCPTGSGAMGPVYVCNYAHGTGSEKTPYTSGASCAACPNKCRNKLCSCGNKICRNKSKLNIATCQCECEKQDAKEGTRAFNKGSVCDQDNCAAFAGYFEPGKCKNNWYQKHKAKYAAYKTCPFATGKCKGVCSAELMRRNSCKKGSETGKLNTSTCKCEFAAAAPAGKCPREFDKEVCYKGYPEPFCKKYAKAFMDKQCPYMCGTCATPCKAVWPQFKKSTTCGAGQVPDLATCTCKGDSNLPACTKPDNQYCGPIYKTPMCPNPALWAPGMCPKMCGKCA